VKRYFGVVLPFVTSDFDEIIVRTPIDMQWHISIMKKGP
jgi:hypothetical protein